MDTNNNANNSHYELSVTNINIKLTQSYNDFELNNLEYNNALIQDNRSFIEIYISFIKTKQPINFTFFFRK